jgi:hypothetical protein
VRVSVARVVQFRSALEVLEYECCKLRRVSKCSSVVGKEDVSYMKSTRVQEMIEIGIRSQFEITLIKPIRHDYILVLGFLGNQKQELINKIMRK